MNFPLDVRFLLESAKAYCIMVCGCQVSVRAGVRELLGAKNIVGIRFYFSP